MKKVIAIFATFALLAIVSQNVMAQQSGPASASSNTEAIIITPIAISNSQALNFGNIASGTAGTVSVDTDGQRTSTGPTLPAATPGTITAAHFDVTGLANATYSITLTNTSFDVTRSGGSETMLVNNIVTTPTPTGTLDGSGEQQIKVGATLTVDANQAAGTYTNLDALEITVDYN
jgi:hypothetical protein